MVIREIGLYDSGVVMDFSGFNSEVIMASRQFEGNTFCACTKLKTVISGNLCRKITEILSGLGAEILSKHRLTFLLTRCSWLDCLIHWCNLIVPLLQDFYFYVFLGVVTITGVGFVMLCKNFCYLLSADYYFVVLCYIRYFVSIFISWYFSYTLTKKRWWNRWNYVFPWFFSTGFLENSNKCSIVLFRLYLLKADL